MSGRLEEWKYTILPTFLSSSYPQVRFILPAIHFSNQKYVFCLLPTFQTSNLPFFHDISPRQPAVHLAAAGGGFAHPFPSVFQTKKNGPACFRR